MPQVVRIAQIALFVEVRPQKSGAHRQQWGGNHPKIGRHVPPNAHQWSTNTETQIHKYKLLSQSDQIFLLDMALIPNQLHSNQDESDE